MQRQGREAINSVTFAGGGQALLARGHLFGWRAGRPCGHRPLGWQCRRFATATSSSTSGGRWLLISSATAELTTIQRSRACGDYPALS